jgi:hypothetical protein
MVPASHAPLHSAHRRFSYPTLLTASSFAFHALGCESHSPMLGSHKPDALPVAGVSIFWAFLLFICFRFFFFFMLLWLLFPFRFVLVPFFPAVPFSDSNRLLQPSSGSCCCFQVRVQIGLP